MIGVPKPQNIMTSSNSSLSDEIVRLVRRRKPSELKLSPGNVNISLCKIESGFLPSSLFSGDNWNQSTMTGVPLNLKSQKRLIFGVPTTSAMTLPDSGITCSGITSSAVGAHSPMESVVECKVVESVVECMYAHGTCIASYNHAACSLSS